MAPDYLTNITPPPVDASKSAIENSLELTALSHIGPDVFTNTRPLWRPPGARGIYGGAVIAHCLVAGQFTIPSHFTVHSMHCYFVLAGDSEIPVIYHVDRVREGKSFATRTVQAKQRGRCIFTTTISFTHDNSETAVITHTIPLPEGLKPPPNDDKIVEMVRANQGRPFLSDRFKASSLESNNPHERKARQWIKTAGKINPGADYKTHISALAYMSDSYFIRSVPMIHGVLRHWPKPEELSPQLSSDAESSKRNKRAGVVSMLVSLDHTIYFHQARGFMADEWIFAEVSSPWSGDGRAVVTQHMFARDGTLIATCFQEGVVRMQQEEPMRPQL